MYSSAAKVLQDVLNHLESSHIQLSDFLLYVLHQYSNQNPLQRDLADNATQIISALYFHSGASKEISAWAHHLKCNQYKDAIHDLARKDNGWHFGATHTQPSQVCDFRLEDMIQKMHQLAPELCELVQCLLGSDTIAFDPSPANATLDSDDEDLWNAVGIDGSGVEIESAKKGSADTPGASQRLCMSTKEGKAVLRKRFIRIVCYSCILDSPCQ